MSKPDHKKYAFANEAQGPIDGLHGDADRASTLSTEEKKLFVKWMLHGMLKAVDPANPAAITIAAFIEAHWKDFLEQEKIDSEFELLTPDEKELLDNFAKRDEKWIRPSTAVLQKAEDLIRKLTDLTEVNSRDFEKIEALFGPGGQYVKDKSREIEKIKEYGQRLGLEQEALDALSFIWTYSRAEMGTRTLLSSLQMYKTKNYANLLAVLLGRKEEKYYNALESLMGAGFIDTGIASGDRQLPRMSEAMLTLAKEADTIDDMLDQALGERIKPDFGKDAFRHVRILYDEILSLLHGVAKHPDTGNAIYLWSEAGVGKTELVKTLGAEPGVELRFIAEKSRVGEAMTSQKRMAMLFMALKAAAVVNRTENRKIVLVFEEADMDFLRHFHNNFLSSPQNKDMGDFSKLFFTRMFDQMKVPFIMTGNVPAFMWVDFISTRIHNLQMRPPSGLNQIPIIQTLDAMLPGNLEGNAETKSGLSKAEIKQLALGHQAVPRTWDRVIKATFYADNPLTTARYHLDQQARAGNVQILEGVSLAKEYDPKLVNIDSDNPFKKSGQEIIETLIALGMTSWTAIFSGKPGTSKSQTALYIADKLNVGIRRMHLPTILSAENPFAAITEQFRAARDEHCMLICDEADALLSVRGPESPQTHLAFVGTLNTQLETHPLPVVLTTNMGNNLDGAVLRRSPFYLKFMPMGTEQLKTACKQFFDNEVLSGGILQMKDLVVADFAEAKKLAASYRIPIMANNIHDILTHCKKKRLRALAS